TPRRHVAQRRPGRLRPDQPGPPAAGAAAPPVHALGPGAREPVAEHARPDAGGRAPQAAGGRGPGPPRLVTGAAPGRTDHVAGRDRAHRTPARVEAVGVCVPGGAAPRGGLRYLLPTPAAGRAGARAV